MTEYHHLINRQACDLFLYSNTALYMEENKCDKSEYMSTETLNNAFEVQFCFRVTFYILSKTLVACRAMELRFSCGIIVKTIGYIYPHWP